MTPAQRYQRKLDHFAREERDQAHDDAVRRAVDRYARIQGSSLTPNIRMVVSPWSVDEFGNRTRTVRAVD